MTYPDKKRNGKWLMAYTQNGKCMYSVGGQIYSGILTRCKPLGKEQLRNPAYKGTTCNFNSFQEFMEWAVRQVGYGQEGWQIDKDIIKKGNKTYCPELCVFVPKAVNVFFTSRVSERGKFPMGVSQQRSGKFMARCRNGDGTLEYLGTSYLTPEDAFASYKEYKERKAKELATKWEGIVDDIVTFALRSYTVSIND